MHIRPYHDSDLPLLCQIFLRAVRETASRDYTPAQIAAWAQVDETRWRQKLADSIGLVAEVEHQPVGFITAIGTHIDLLFVSRWMPALRQNPVLQPMALRWWLSSG